MAQVQTQNVQTQILGKKAIKKIVKMLGDNEYYYYRQIPNSLMDIMPLMDNLWLNVTENLRIMRLELSNKIIYLILDEAHQELYILRNDSRTFEKMISDIKNTIINEILRYFHIGNNYKIVSNKTGLYIISEKPLVLVSLSCYNFWLNHAFRF